MLATLSGSATRSPLRIRKQVDLLLPCSLRGAVQTPCRSLRHNSKSFALESSATSELKTEDDHIQAISSSLSDPTGNTVMIAQVAPAVRVALGEEFDMPVGTPVQGKVVSALRQLGFDYVFDVAAGADLTILEEGSELLHRIIDNLENKPDALPLPMFSSCCPGWIDLVEKSSPEMIPYISTSKSPHMMQGSVIKTFFSEIIDHPEEDLVVTSIMPCVRKQGEADRDFASSCKEGGHRNVDHVVTTKGLANMIKEAGIDFQSLPDGHFDAFMGYGTGGGLLFGSTGGVLEAALRTVYEVAAKGSDKPNLDRVEFKSVRGLDGIREAVIVIPPNPNGVLHNKEEFQLRVAVCSGLGNAKSLIKKLMGESRENEGEPMYHFVEVMACPGGCIGGGGQPRSKDKDALKKRQRALYGLDESSEIRSSHLNPVIQNLYDKYLIEPCSERAEKLLHTRQTSRIKSSSGGRERSIASD
jgi:NADP-reducing hydrogenase subunit HndD